MTTATLRLAPCTGDVPSPSDGIHQLVQSLRALRIALPWVNPKTFRLSLLGAVGLSNARCPDAARQCPFASSSETSMRWRTCLIVSMIAASTCVSPFITLNRWADFAHGQRFLCSLAGYQRRGRAAPLATQPLPPSRGSPLSDGLRRPTRIAEVGIFEQVSV